MTLVVAALAGCGSEPALAPLPPLAPDAARSGAAWLPVASSMSRTLVPAAENPCSRGGPDCMPAVVREMTRRLQPLAAACDGMAPFLVMYRQVSREVGRSVAARAYDDPAFVAHLDAVFATLYFNAADAWAAGRRSEVPRAWRVAYGAAERHAVNTLGGMLLGMNAHISRDLPYAVAAVGLRSPDGSSARADVVGVNRDIGRSQAPMLAEIARRFDPSINTVIGAAKLADPKLVGSVISGWRNEAIADGRALIAARDDPARLRAVQTRIDTKATMRALLVYRATAYADPARESRAPARWCAAHGRVDSPDDLGG
jgi:hypothetical protein